MASNLVNIVFQDRLATCLSAKGCSLIYLFEWRFSVLWSAPQGPPGLYTTHGLKYHLWLHQSLPANDTTKTVHFHSGTVLTLPTRNRITHVLCTAQGHTVTCVMYSTGSHCHMCYTYSTLFMMLHLLVLSLFHTWAAFLPCCCCMLTDTFTMSHNC